VKRSREERREENMRKSDLRFEAERQASKRNMNIGVLRFDIFPDIFSGV
jgi:hypothetical protein